MSNVYYGCSVYRYPSKISDKDDHKTPELARAFDRELAIRLVTMALPTEFEAAMTNEPRPDLAKALRWLADEIDATAYPPQTAPAPNE